MLSLKRVFLGFLMVIGIGPSLSARTVELNPERTLYLIGAVDQKVVTLVQLLTDMRMKSREPIALVINSPGGSVTAGYFLIAAMDEARASGVQIDCVVGNMAASMAFNILMHCSRGYMFSHSLLLWHPPRIAVMAALSAKDTEQLTTALLRIDASTSPIIQDKLGINKAFFYQHYYAETLWLGKELNQNIHTNYLRIVDSVEGLPVFVFSSPYQSSDSGQEKSSAQLIPFPLDLLFNNAVIRWIYQPNVGEGNQK